MRAMKPAYSSAAAGSWMEHGPAMTAKRSSRPLTMSVMARRPARVVVAEAADSGTTVATVAGVTTTLRPVILVFTRPERSTSFARSTPSRCCTAGSSSANAASICPFTRVWTPSRWSAIRVATSRIWSAGPGSPSIVTTLHRLDEAARRLGRQPVHPTLFDDLQDGYSSTDARKRPMRRSRTVSAPSTKAPPRTPASVSPWPRLHACRAGHPLRRSRGPGHRRAVNRSRPEAPRRLDRGRELRGHPPLPVAGLASVAPDAGTRPGLLRHRCLLRRCADGPAWLSEPRPQRGHREVRPQGSVDLAACLLGPFRLPPAPPPNSCRDRRRRRRVGPAAPAIGTGLPRGWPVRPGWRKLRDRRSIRRHHRTPGGSPMPERPATVAYRAARDELLSMHGDYAKAVGEFRWPTFEGPFNWAVDWFDSWARGSEATGLHIVEEDGRIARFTFAELVRRSDQVAAWLRAQGVAKGDRVVLMLGNQVELWESMLAVMKLGAVIMPTTTALGPADLIDRIERGGAKHVVVNSIDTGKFDTVSGSYTRIAVGEAPAGWLAYAETYAADDAPAGHPGTVATDPLLLYFTSGTTSRPKLVEHTQVSYPVGHLSTMYWLGLQPGDVHLNISSPGWVKHAWSCFFAPWIAEVTIYLYNYRRFDAPALLDQLREHEVTTFCAPPTVWRMLIKSDLSGGPGALREVIGAGEPLNPEVIEQVRAAWGLTIRDGYGQTETTAQVGNTPGTTVKPGSMGKPLPGLPVVLVDPSTDALVEGVGEGEICLDLSQHPLPLMTAYQGDDERNAEAMAGGYYHTGDVASRDEDGYITYIGRTDDVFKASDYKISPFELESVLIEHPAV